MATPIIMPKVDMVMEKGTFMEWLKKEGQAVEKGEAIYVMMTDKAAIEVEAPASGILAGLTARPDDQIPVSQVVGYILQPGESLLDIARPHPAGGPVGLPPAPAPAAAPESVAGDGGQGLAGNGMQLVRATPLARNLAREMKLDLSQHPRQRAAGTRLPRRRRALFTSPPATGSRKANRVPVSAGNRVHGGCFAAQAGGSLTSRPRKRARVPQRAAGDHRPAPGLQHRHYPAHPLYPADRYDRGRAPA